ncbi:MAG: hypothetical protein ACI8W8_002245, partial [Rhodothermales bacterium]
RKYGAISGKAGSLGLLMGFLPVGWLHDERQICHAGELYPLLMKQVLTTTPPP